MPRLLNQFDLKAGVSEQKFTAAWQVFVDHLLHEGLAQSGTPVFRRLSESGYDTDEALTHQFMAIIEFADQPQADLAWGEIEKKIESLGRLHRRVIACVDDPIFTFWGRA